MSKSATSRRHRSESNSPPSVAAPISRSNWFRGCALAALATLFVATPLIPSESAAEHGAGVVFNLLWLLLLLGWLVGSWAIGGSLRIRFGRADAVAVVFLLLVVASGLLMFRQVHARPLINQTWQWIAMGIGFFLVRQMAEHAPDRRTLCGVLIAMSCGLSCFGFFQAAYRMPQVRADFERDPQRVLREAGVAIEADSPEFQLFKNRLYSSEPTATFALTNSLAGFLAPWLVLAGGLIPASWRDRGLRRRLVSTLAIAAVAIGLCLLLTKSRTALLAVALGGGLLCLTELRRGWRFHWRIPAIVATAGLLLLAIAVFGGSLDWLVISETPKSLLYRLEFWRATAALIADHPWFGCGLGNFQESYAAYKLPQASELVADPHNFLLEIWATAGTPAAIGFTAFLLLAVGRCWIADCTVRSVRNGTDGTDGTDLMDGNNPFHPATTPTTRWAFIAILAGVLLAFPVGAIVGLTPDFAVLFVVLIPAVACLWGLRDWIIRGKLPPRLLLVSAIVLLTNLLAAGGIGFAGVAQNLWLLLALGLTAAEVDSGVRPRPLHRGLAGAAIVAALLLTVAFYVSMYRPVLGSQIALAEAGRWQAAGRAAELEAALHRAAASDPFSATPWQHLAALHHQLWLAQPTASQAANFDRAVAESQLRDPHSHTAARQFGQWRLIMASRAKGDDTAKFLSAAIADFQRWVDLYPNHSLAHAQLAWTWHLSGDSARAAAAAAEALRLDLLHSHSERKLSAQHLFDPISNQQFDNAATCMDWLVEQHP